MDLESRDWEIRFKDLLFSILYQWKKIVVLAVVFALVLGGLQAAQALASFRNSVDEQETDAERRMLKERVSSFEQMIENQEKYLAESELMLMDTHDAYEAMVSIYISTDYQIIPELVYQDLDNTGAIVAVYEAVLGSNAVINEVADEVGMEGTYLKELLTVSSTATGMLHITVWHSDMEIANEIITLLVEHMQAAKPRAVEIVDDHSLDVVVKTVGKYAGDFIGSRQGTEADRLLDLNEELISWKTKLAALGPEQTEAETSGSVITTGIKWGIVGGVLGAFLTVAVIACMFIFGNTVYSADELHDRYGIKKIGCVVNSKRRFDPITRMIRKLEGRIIENSDSNWDLIGANIDIYCKNAKSILLTGGTGNDEVVSLAEALQEKMPGIKFVPCGSVLNDANALRNLSECDAVLLVAACNKSVYKTIVLEVERITDAGRQIAGAVVIG